MEVSLIKKREVKILLRLKREKKSQEPRKRRVLEHLIRLVNIFLLAAERFHLKSDNYEQLILVICGLIRGRIVPKLGVTQSPEKLDKNSKTMSLNSGIFY